MTLPELAVRRRVLAAMLSAVLVLFGLISYQRLGVDRFPDVDFPIVSVTTLLPGADPLIVDASLTSVIEEAVNGIPGLDRIQSLSSPGVSLVVATFELGKDRDVAFDEVQARVSQVLHRLPEEAEPPVVSKVLVGGAPILWLALQGDRTLQQLQQYARNVLKPRLETIDGVGEVQIGGERRRTIRVEVDPERLAAHGLTASDLVRAFAAEHLQLPAGFVVRGATERLLRLDLEFHTPQALEALVVAHRPGRPVRLGDVARVVDGLADARQLARYNGRPAVGLGIVKVSGANTVAIVDEVRRRLHEEILPALPPGMSLEVATDDSTFIRRMVAALQEHLLLGTLAAAAAVWLFLRSLRSTLIIATAVPVSLLGAVAVMHFAGYTFNTMTLLALLLLIGVVVDDAIVVLENVHRHRERLDPDPVSAALRGTREVVFAVLAATLSLVAIFGPVIFMGGIIGRFFESFAVVVTVGVLVSWLVSMTLTPMLCSRYLQVRQAEGPVQRLLHRLWDTLEGGYRRLLAAALRHRWAMVGLTVAVTAASGWLFLQVGKTFVPEEDEGRFMVIFKTPLGASLDYTVDRLEAVERALAAQPGVAGYFTAIGLGAQGQVNQGFAFVRLAPREERARSQEAIMADVRQALEAIPGVQAFAMRVPIVTGTRGEPLQFSLRGPRLEEVARLAQAMRERLARVPGIGRLDLDLQLDLPEIVPRIDRDRAARLGIPAREIGLALRVLAGGLDVAKYNDVPGDGRRYDIRLKAAEGSLQGPEDLARLHVRAADGSLVRLDTVVRLEETLGPAVIGRDDLQYAALFFASPTIPLADAVAAVEEAARELLPPGYTVAFQGQAEEFGKTAGYMAFAFVTALVLLYMVLASQFDSYLQPLVIMMAQPLAMAGGVAALWLTGHTLNIYSMIGMVLLVGLVAKNGILLVDFANQHRQRGLGIDEALREACPLRLRPVLMTSLTVILVLLPTALGMGAGADTNAPLAVAVIGGMASSTLLTLVVVPAVYSLTEHGLARLQGRRR